MHTLGSRCRATYPNKIPVIVQYHNNPFANHNLLLNEDATIDTIFVSIRRRVRVPHCKTMIAYVNDNLLDNKASLTDIFQKYKHTATDDCLHITIHWVDTLERINEIESI